MSRQLRMLASLLALLGVALLLVADEADQTCAGIEGVRSTVTFETNCTSVDGAVVRGTITFDVDPSSEGDAALLEEGVSATLQAQAEAGGLEVSAVDVGITCEDEGEVGRLETVYFTFDQGTSLATIASAITCNASGLSEAQEIVCTGAEGASCGLNFTP